MSPEEHQRLQEILLKYQNLRKSKEDILKEAPYGTHYSLLYDWISNREISLAEFISLLKHLKSL
jgi:hypothetical protein